ncbi:MAG: class I SAM-dependent methyltransferase [Halioglobus sp.]|nr:class I SAM-dependent methyltransferase [Halioglobus sp.]
MDLYAYQDMRRLQEEHWWFKARREILSEVLSGLRLPRDADILEIGCGTGGNLLMLSRFGNVCGMEMHEESAGYAMKNSVADVRTGSLPYQVPFSKKFDLICLLDVLEHIEEDESAVGALKDLLKPGGRVVITVPAYQWMFGRHDKMLHHFRRYSRKNLCALFSLHNFCIAKESYFNTFLFPAAVVSRMMEYWNDGDRPKYAQPTAWINALCYRMFRFERLLLKELNLPFGCSLLLVTKPAIVR